MCELLAMSCRYPARLTRSLSALAAHAKGQSRNRDGWGAAYYAEHDVALYRGLEAADDSASNDDGAVKWLENHGPTTTLSIAYIRHATHGAISLANTGPFCRELAGRMHVFAHNGFLANLQAANQEAAQHFSPIGNTDSEQAFCELLTRMQYLAARGPYPPDVEQRLLCVSNFAAELSRCGPANFLYSDADVLFAHADRRLQPDTGLVAAPALFKLDCSTAAKHLVTRDCRSDDDNAPQRMILLASVPLSDEDWHPLPQGEVLAIKGGTVLASQHY